MQHHSPAAVSGSARDWLSFHKLRSERGNLSKSQDDPTAWGLLSLAIHIPMDMDSPGSAQPGSFEGSGTNGLFLCAQPLAPQGNHLPTSDSNSSEPSCTAS